MRPVKRRILVVTPAWPGGRGGNRVSALRWAAILRRLGCAVRIADAWRGEPCDVLVALHARKSHASVARFRAERPRAPLVVVLTGTDLYDELARSPEAQQSLEAATRLVVLQPRGLDALPARVRDRARPILQSARPPARRPAPTEGVALCVLAHLRAVKDPFLPALAVRLLPPHSRIRVVHVGAALDAGAEARARAEAIENPRWRWLGPRRRAEALGILAASRALVVSSRSEGGANVVSEAIACGVPVLSTWIPGSLGVLGDDYPGFYPPGDAAALARLALRLEGEPGFEAALRARIAALGPLVDPAVEVAAWRALLEELGST